MNKTYNKKRVVKCCTLIFADELLRTCSRSCPDTLY